MAAHQTTTPDLRPPRVDIRAAPFLSMVRIDKHEVERAIDHGCSRLQRAHAPYVNASGKVGFGDEFELPVELVVVAAFVGFRAFNVALGLPGPQIDRNHFHVRHPAAHVKREPPPGNAEFGAAPVAVDQAQAANEFPAPDFSWRWLVSSSGFHFLWPL